MEKNVRVLRCTFFTHSKQLFFSVHISVVCVERKFRLRLLTRIHTHARNIYFYHFPKNQFSLSHHLAFVSLPLSVPVVSVDDLSLEKIYMKFYNTERQFFFKLLSNDMSMPFNILFLAIMVKILQEIVACM